MAIDALFMDYYKAQAGHKNGVSCQCIGIIQQQPSLLSQKQGAAMSVCGIDVQTGQNQGQNEAKNRVFTRLHRDYTKNATHPDTTPAKKARGGAGEGGHGKVAVPSPHPSYPHFGIQD